MEYYTWLCVIGLVPGRLCYSDLTSPGTAAENYFYYFPSAESANLSPFGLTPSADIDRFVFSKIFPLIRVFQDSSHHILSSIFISSHSNIHISLAGQLYVLGFVFHIP